MRSGPAFVQRVGYCILEESRLVPSYMSVVVTCHMGGELVDL